MRCSWLNADEMYRDYHDTEWGVAVRGDQAVFERITLEGFQAGLSWITILKRREGIERLMKDEGIIRNRAKIESTIRNANLVLEMQRSGQSISDIVWSFAPPVGKRKRSASSFEWVATTAESEALSKHLRKLGFGFVGATTMYALMQATGMVNDHAPGCFRRNQL